MEATIKNTVLTHNGENDLLAGQRVNVELVGTVFNSLYRRIERAYRITSTGFYIYESGLTDIE